MLVLMVLSFTLAEFLTGSTPVLTALLDPVALAFLFGLYGCGVLLVREAALRWRTGWSGVLFLGLAYGVVEEGFGTKTFFSTTSSVVGRFATYGHLAGVNWVWVVMLTIFHAVFSIALPILLLGLLLPATRGRPLVELRSLLVFLALFLGTVAVMFVLTTSENPTVPVLVLFLAIVAVLVIAARRVGPPTLRWVVRGGVLPPRALLAVGAGFVWGFFFLNWVGSTLLPWPAVVIGSVLALTTLTAVLVLPEIDRGHSPYGRTLLAVGLLSFLLFFAAVVTVSGDWGAPLALIGVAGIIVYLLRATGAVATPTAGLPTVP